MFTRRLMLIAVLFFSCMCGSFINAQTFTLSISDAALKDTVRTTFASRSDALEAARSAYYDVLDEGYLLAEADTVSADSSITLTIRRKNQYKLGGLIIAEKGGRSEQFKSNDGLGTTALYRGFGSTIKEFENEGYPFAAIQLDSLQWMNARKDKTPRALVYATLTKGPLILNDSLHIRSSAALPIIYLKNYVDFRKGIPYSEQRMQQTEKRLREIPFLQVKRPPEVRFRDGKADLFLFVERKKANYFNGIAGLRPDEQTGKVNVTGDAEIRLMNAFNRGEELGLVWRKLQPLTQDLTVKTTLPYLFKSPLAIDGRVQIYKRDTSFTSVQLLAGLGVFLPRNQRLRAFIESNRSDRLTSFYTAGSLANTQQTLYGLSTQLSELDYRWNPRKGYSLQMEGATGYRTTSGATLDVQGTVRRPLSRIEAQTEYYI
ncbi:MAG: hypothetical protein ACKOSR_03050, partial [Flavobacteriales bacterium]